MTVEDLRLEFPSLSASVNGCPLVYLDNAATAMRPVSVVEKWVDITRNKNSNIYRAVHTTAAIATKEVEDARESVRAFIGADNVREVIFTSGATASLNLLAFSFGEAFVGEGDEIIVSAAEHHANIVPWQMMCKRKGALLKVLPVNDRGELRLDLLDSLITKRTKLVSVAHVSNVLGIVNPIREIAGICHRKGVLLAVDGAQGIVHSNVNVKDLDCDFYAFSGHKIYASPGTGVLYGKENLLNALPPYMGGGEMIADVKWRETTYAPLPYKFEAGTPNLAGIPTFIPALEIASRMRCKEVLDNERKIIDYVTDELAKDPDITLFGNPADRGEKVPLFSIAVKGAHHEDLALIMDKMGIALRSGQLCAQPLMDSNKVTGMLRASFAAYNTIQEAEYFIKSLHRAMDMLR